MQNGCGVLLYVTGHEGRGIGLTHKIRAYKLQEEGMDTYAANRALHLPDECRDYTAPRAILHQLGIKSITLLTNNPEKVFEFSEFGTDGKVKVRTGRRRDELVCQVRHVPVVVKPTLHSAAYLHSKRHREAQVPDPQFCVL